MENAESYKKSGKNINRIMQMPQENANSEKDRTSKKDISKPFIFPED